MLTKKEVTICIIELRAPSTECWNNLNLDSDDGHSIADPYRWICDRYLYSDLAQWAAPSLRFEYRYITRGDLNGFPKKDTETKRFKFAVIGAVAVLGCFLTGAVLAALGGSSQISTGEDDDPSEE